MGSLADDKMLALGSAGSIADRERTYWSDNQELMSNDDRTAESTLGVGWAVWGSATVLRSTAEKRSGSASVLWTPTAAVYGGIVWSKNWSPSALQKFLEFRGWIKNPIRQSPGGQVGMICRQNFSAPQPNTATFLDQQVTLTPDGDWQPFTCLFKTYSTTTSVQMYAVGTLDLTDRIYLDDMNVIASVSPSLPRTARI